MARVQLLKSALFNVSIKDNSVLERTIEHNDDFVRYCKNVLQELVDTKRNKSYKFKDTNELVPRHVVSLIENQDDWEERTKNIAEKLLNVEIDVQARMEHLDIEIQKGALLILLLLIDNEKRFAILKIEHNGFLDENDVKLKQGLPEKTRLQKTCLACINSNNNEIEQLLISDSGKGISEYWWNRFLSTEELSNSEKNTTNAFMSIDNFLRKEIKDKSPADYWLIRNDTISYFRNNETFAFNDFVEKIKSHKFENEELENQKDQFITKLNKLPEDNRKGFDTQFELSAKVLKARMKKTIILDENFELKINGEITDFSNKIKADIDSVGKYIKIYTDKGYKEFGGIEDE
ncbi:nucleoid-associated protein [Providencia rettgeri]|uniref:Nucleoid-associated protein n=1 Tax=Providencia rettgeri TaxID=587 RepID=A0AAJ4NIM3_PRORE|nr:nucleoid-associated protein [Providencia rettgeri]QWQ16694.1 nucleoid-associated protein [Providencia rettgeri]QWQ20528.1 nucleoid-associated protein [Providencia rettgeri]QWQ24363.1 nucleoid-associated protein [Providencia rettgeri]